MQMVGRKYTATTGAGYRFGFNGKEDDKDINVGVQDYGMRIYDNRLGRYISVDPEFYKGRQYSPYVQEFNNPISFIDENGAWSIFTHYRMVKRALMKAGISKKTAEEIANYASTYADGGHGFILGINQAIGIFGGTPPLKLARKDKDGEMDKSQDDISIQMVSIHAMKAAFEGISDKEAIDRALHGGTFKDVNGNEIKIEGALNVIERFKGRDIEQLSTKEKKELGLALHTIQDAEAHKGKRWVNTSDGKKEAKKRGYKNGHSLFNDLFGFIGMKKAKEKTKLAIEVIVNQK
jgi:RHS repeat-associated protein